MTKAEVNDLLKFLELNYSNFQTTKEVTNYWNEELQSYDLNDVKIKLKELMSKEKYQFSPPLLENIKSGLVPKAKKVDFSKIAYFCHYCNRPFNEREELETHQDRCSSVKYIERQYKRFNLGVIDNVAKAKLYAMSEKEFDERYKKLLRIVQEKTNDELEKTTIEFIFNPPSLKKAKTFLESEV